MEGQPSIKWRGVEMGWVFGWQHVGMQRWTTRSLSALEERTDQGIFYLHIMALHAERELLRSGRWHFVLSYFFCCRSCCCCSKRRADTSRPI